LLFSAPKSPVLAETNARQGFFERAEFEAVVAHIDDGDLRDFLQWFFATGMRPGEIRSLGWDAFDRETWTIRLHARDAKSGYGRVLPLEDDLRAVIERRINSRRPDCDRIFHRNGRPVGEFRKTWANACFARRACDTGGAIGRQEGDPSAPAALRSASHRGPQHGTRWRRPGRGDEDQRSPNARRV
jgi:integrase